GGPIERVQEEIRVQLHPGAGVKEQELGLTWPTTRVIEYAGEESHRTGDSYTDTAHLMVGLLREREGIAFQVLTKHGATVERVRREIDAFLSDPTSSR